MFLNFALSFRNLSPLKSKLKSKERNQLQEEFSSNYFPEHLLEYLFKYFDYPSLLTSRRVCSEWNAIIMVGILPPKTIFNILPNHRCKFWKRQLQKKNCSALIPNLSGKWSNLHVHNLKNSISFWKSGSNYIDFSNVTDLTLYEGDFTLQQLVCKMMSRMSGLLHFQVTESYFQGKQSHFPYDTITPFQRYTRKNNWILGIETISRLETFRIGVHSWISTVMYLKLMSIPRIGNLKKIVIDFSKIFGLPFNSVRIQDTYNYVADLVSLNAMTLTDMRMKWCHRVETDEDISRYEQEQEYFLFFLDMLGSPKWPNAEILQLSVLELGFPHVNFNTPMIELVFLPFLRRQRILEHIFLARIQLSPAFYRFNMRLSRNFFLRREYGVYIRDLDPSVIGLTFSSILTSIEFHIMWAISFHLALHPIHRNRAYFDWNSNRAPHVMSLRLYNSKSNPFFASFNIPDIVSTFPRLRQLELLDESDPNYPIERGRVGFDNLIHHYSNAKCQLTNTDFLLIVNQLPWLVSLKLSNLTKITDSGLTGISPSVVSRMQKLGNYYAKPNEIPTIPLLSRMRHLKFLELRNLSSKVSDLSIFFGFQHIRKLDKIAFHGDHEITSWGTRILEARFRNNPRFAIFLKKFVHIPFYNDFP